eukprot:SAG31_NODE_4326_length_3354_cov_11.627035_1_plen_46_part_00
MVGQLGGVSQELLRLRSCRVLAAADIGRSAPMKQIDTRHVEPPSR